MEHRFFDYSYCHIKDGRVDISVVMMTPFEVIFRYLKSVDPNMVDDASFKVYYTSALTSEGLDTESVKANIIFHYLENASDDDVAKAIEKTGGEHVKLVEAFLEASRYNVKVVNKDNVTDIFWQCYLGDTSAIIIKTAFCLKLLCPTLFTGKPTEYPDAFMKAMKDIEKDEYNKCWARIEPMYLKCKKEQWLLDLKDVFVNTYSDQISRIESERESAYTKIEDYSRRISEMYKAIEDYNIKINGMLANNQSEQQYNDFVEFLGHINAEIVNYAENGRSLIIQFRGFADNYDPDAAADVIKESRSYMYSSAGDSREALKKLYEEVFINQNYKLCVASNIELKPRDYYYHAIPINNGTAADINGVSYLQNPHLRHHNCFGDNGGDIEKALAAFDYYTVAMYMNAANSNLSFTDSTVMRELGADIIKNKKKKMFLGKDGKYYSFVDIVKEAEDSGTEAEE